MMIGGVDLDTAKRRKRYQVAAGQVFEAKRQRRARARMLARIKAGR
jgi:hypothetical protein